MNNSDEKLWTQYAAAAIASQMSARYAAITADEMLAEHHKRFPPKKPNWQEESE